MTTETVPAPAAEPKTQLEVKPITWVVAGVGALLCFVRFGFSGDAVVGSIFVGSLVVIAATDLERRIIPDVVLVPASIVVLLLNIALHPKFEWIIAGAAAFAFFFVVALINPKGLGMGDVKLAFFLGAGLGWNVVGALVLGMLGAAVYAIALVLTRPGAGAKTAFALGPFLSGAAIVVFFLAR
jgi:leader peptidase (prepilin peptidase) / N-methyltransferase